MIGKKSPKIFGKFTEKAKSLLLIDCHLAAQCMQDNYKAMAMATGATKRSPGKWDNCEKKQSKEGRARKIEIIRATQKFLPHLPRAPC